MAARGGVEMCLGLVLVLMLWHGAQAQSGCTNAMISLSPCLNYVTGNTSTPSQSCCTQLDSVVKSTPQCLCSLMNGAAVANGPAGSPALSPEASPAAVPATSPSSPADGSTNDSPSSTTAQTPTIPSGTGSKSVPSTNGNTSAGNFEKPFHLSTVILFLAAVASIFINF